MPLNALGIPAAAVGKAGAVYDDALGTGKIFVSDGTIWKLVFDPGFVPAIPSASDALPLADGTAAAGVGTLFSRDDHVHPAGAAGSSAEYLGVVGSTITVTPDSADYELLYSDELSGKNFLVHYALTCSDFAGSATLKISAVDETKTLIAGAIMDGIRTINGTIDTFSSRTNYGYMSGSPSAGHCFGTFALTIPVGYTGEVHLQVNAVASSGDEITVYLRHITIIGVQP